MFYNHYLTPESSPFAKASVNPLDVHLPISDDQNWMSFGMNSPLNNYSSNSMDVFNTTGVFVNTTYSTTFTPKDSILTPDSEQNDRQKRKRQKRQ
jgi:hypothetical protein